MLLPDSLTLGGAALGLVSAPLRGLQLLASGLGTAMGFCPVVSLVFVRAIACAVLPGMGLGDAKLLRAHRGVVWLAGRAVTLLAGSVLGPAVAVYVARGRLEGRRALREREELERELQGAWKLSSGKS